MNAPLKIAGEGTTALAELALRKFELLSQLDALSRRQLELIDAAEMSQLLNLLAAKQGLLAELKEIGEQLSPFRDQDPESRRWTSAAQRQRCAELFAGCDLLFARVIDQEKQGEIRLRRCRDETAQRLQNAHAAGQVRSAYAPAAAVAGRIDVSSDL